MNMDLKTSGTEYIMNILSLFIWSNVIKKKCSPLVMIIDNQNKIIDN